MLTQVLKRRSVLVLISDFTEPIPMETAAVLARRHDFITAVMEDSLEKDFRLPARLAVHDPETGRVGYLSPTSSTAFRKAQEFRESQLRALVAKGVDRFELKAGDNVLPPLIGFFRKRIERLGRR
jgi:hypothetical protein